MRDSPEAGTDVQALYTYKRTAQTTLAEARANPERLLLEVAPRETPRSFRITLRRPIGRGGLRGGKDNFIDKTRQQVVDFYGDVVQAITPWRPAPARLPRTAPEPDPAGESPVSAGIQSAISEEGVGAQIGTGAPAEVRRPAGEDAVS